MNKAKEAEKDWFWFELLVPDKLTNMIISSVISLANLSTALEEPQKT